jgi:uncharacterized membrane protein
LKSDEIRFTALLIMVIIVAATVYQGFFPKKSTEHFSELGILGPNMKIADYPKELRVNESFTLYLYIGNREGKIAYYRILVKLGNKSSFINETVPMDAPIIAKYEKVLMNNETWIYPISLSINKEGVNLRLVFEMWIYDEAVNGFKYYGRWNQLWLNVTASKPS